MAVPRRSASPVAQVRDFLSERSREGCIEWEGFVNRGGYGHAVGGSKWMTAHRAAWISENGPIPDGMVVRHKCDNRPCVNPDHLEIGTQRENVRDRDLRQRRHGRYLHDHEVLEVRRMREQGATYAEIQAVYEASITTISHAVNRKRRFSQI